MEMFLVSLPLPTPLITLHLSGHNATQHSAVGTIVLSICNDLVRLYSVQIEVEMASSSVLVFIIYSILFKYIIYEIGYYLKCICY